MQIAPHGNMGIGASAARDPRQCGRDSVHAALAGRDPGPDDLVLVFPTVDVDPVGFFAGALDAAGRATVVGCTGTGAITSAGFLATGASAAHLPGARMSFGVAGVDQLGDDLYGAAVRATRQARAEAGAAHPHSIVMIFADGLAGDLREIVRGCYTVAGAGVPLVGGAAGANSSTVKTTVFFDRRPSVNGLVVVWINSTEPFGIGVRHGWQPIGEPLIVTRGSGNLIRELDGRPALEAYIQARTETARYRATMLDDVAEPVDDLGPFFSRTVTVGPLGLATASGRYDVRHIVRSTKSGSLVMFGYVNEQSVVQVMAGDPDGLIAAAERAAAEAAGQLTAAVRGALVFSCDGRLPYLGNRTVEEATAVTAGVGGAPVCGFYTYGEFARLTGSTGFHNATVAVLAL